MLVSLSIDSGFHYRTLLHNIRVHNACRDDFEITYGDNVYCYAAGNFRLKGHKTKVTSEVAIAYNHVSVDRGIGKERLKSYLNTAHAGSRMTEPLSVVVALTAEAARSEIVATAFSNVLDTSWVLTPKDFELVFKAYNHTGQRIAGYFIDGDTERPGPQWAPLKDSDYIAYFETLGNGDDTTFRALRRKVDYFEK
jgi:hypothetical protein